MGLCSCSTAPGEMNALSKQKKQLYRCWGMKVWWVHPGAIWISLPPGIPSLQAGAPPRVPLFSTALLSCSVLAKGSSSLPSSPCPYTWAAVADSMGSLLSFLPEACVTS